MKIHPQNLTEKKIEELIQKRSNHRGLFRKENGLKSASVLVPLFYDSEWKLLFIRRTDKMPEHKGQVAFPGGGKAPGDHDAISTALRESQEEIGLEPGNVKILGTFPSMATITDYLITPVIGIIKKQFEPKPQVDEVDRVFSIPLTWLANEDNFEIRDIAINDEVLRHVIFFQPYEGEILWGITAKITVELLVTFGLLNQNSADIS